MSDKKICPLLTTYTMTGRGDVKCLEDKCAWWGDRKYSRTFNGQAVKVDESDCAIKLLAEK